MTLKSDIYFVTLKSDKNGIPACSKSQTSMLEKRKDNSIGKFSEYFLAIYSRGFFQKLKSVRANVSCENKRMSLCFYKIK